MTKSEIIDVFGPALAPTAIMALEAFCTANDLDEEGLISVVENEKAFSDAIQTMRDHLQDVGFSETDEFEKCVLKWLSHKSGKPIISTQVKRESYAPVNLGSAYHRGCLYYPIQTLLRTVVKSYDGAVREAERVDIAVVRSDRTLQTIEESLDESGKLSGIYRLGDGTLLQKKPTASAHSTWSWSSIQEYLARSYVAKPLSVLAINVYKHLRSRVWLPEESDYWLLTFTAITSYLQPIFDAVPLILLHGKPGTGKSELGAAMTEVSCNALMIGQSSASTMMRLMDEARGLVVIDDLESIGTTGGSSGKEKFSEMVQVLKISYKKASATKIVTNARKKTEVMNFFGIKIVSNTKGVDAILGSRMLHIQTQNMGSQDLDEFLSRKGLSISELNELRNDLHIWAFDNVAVVDEVYQEATAGSSQRDEEIAAPLKALAKLSQIPAAQEMIDVALGEQKSKKSTFKSPDHALDYVIEKMASEGMREFTLIEISLRMRAILGLTGFLHNSKPLWAKPEWISRQLRERGWIDSELKRKNLFGYQVKVFSMSDSIRIEKGAIGIRKVGPFDFCIGCAECAYRTAHCDILPYRVKREGL
ncbi:hypothetical protein P5704_025700 (plasmid) [Pseudomonas sp. FeN3W]|nr:hypothetical protein P5704_025700 [Pseudomonas sp. FeN3W]